MGKRDGAAREHSNDEPDAHTLWLAAQKKTIGAVERDEVARSDWRCVAETLPARRVVVVDECSTHRHMCPRYARARRGQRAYAKQPRNYGANVTLLSGLCLEGMTAAMVVEGAVTTAVFEAYVQHILCPTLQPGDIVILDNLAPHHAQTVQTAIQARGARLLFLPPYSPDLSPIENAFAKIKQALRRLRAQTLDRLIEAIDHALLSITPFDAIGFFVQAGFFNLD